MFNRYTIASVAVPEETPRPSVFSPPHRQALIRDDVTTPPVSDPYAALQRASDRLAAGKSVFGICEYEEAVPA